MANTPSRKPPQTRPSKISWTRKQVILEQRLGIEKRAETNEPAAGSNASKQGENAGETNPYRRMMGAHLYQRRTERLNVAPHMEKAFRALKSTLSHAKRFSIGWDIFYDYLSIVIHGNPTAKKSLEKQLMERKILHKIIEMDTHQGVLHIGDALICLEHIHKGYLRELLELKKMKTKIKKETFFREEETIQDKIIELKKIQTRLAPFPAGKKISNAQRRSLNIKKMAGSALRANEKVLADIAGAEEAKAISGAEEVARYYMKMWTQGKRK